MSLLEILGIDLPIVQAPMAGVSSPGMAAAVLNAGALGIHGRGCHRRRGCTPDDPRRPRQHSQRSLNVNVFCHQPAARGRGASRPRGSSTLRPDFAGFDAQPPTGLREIYRSFVADDAMLAVLARRAAAGRELPLRPAVRAAPARAARGADRAARRRPRAWRRPGRCGGGCPGGRGAGIRGGRSPWAFDPDGHDDRLGTAR